MKTGTSVILTLLLLLGNFLHAQIRDNFEAVEHQFKDDKMPYRFLKPLPNDSIEMFPLVLFLHGVTEVGTDNRKQLNHIVMDFAKIKKRVEFPAYVVAPQCPRGKSWGETEWSTTDYKLGRIPSKELRMVNNLIDTLMASYAVDTTRIYIIGLSMGAFGGWEMLHRWPGKFAGGVFVSGNTDVEALSEEVIQTPVWLFNGAKDEHVSIVEVEKLVLRLEQLKADYRFTRFDEQGHNCWNEVFVNPDVYTWLFNKKRK